MGVLQNGEIENNSPKLFLVINIPTPLCNPRFHQTQ